MPIMNELENPEEARKFAFDEAVGTLRLHGAGVDSCVTLTRKLDEWLDAS
jgi:hypothetical protein